jgi:hypothetical protein
MLDQFIDKRAFQDIRGPGRFLTAEQIDTFNRDGCVILRGVFSAARIAELRAAAERLYSQSGGEWVGGPELKNPDLLAHVGSREIQGVIEDLNGPSDVLLGFLYRKLRSDQTPKLWHQDLSYWDSSDARVMALFTPLTEINESNGPIYFIPGSHRLGRLFHTAASNYNLVCDTSAFREPVLAELNVGDVMALHSLTVHSSPGNPSDRIRINFGLHFHNRQTRIVRDAPTAELYEKKIA